MQNTSLVKRIFSGALALFMVLGLLVWGIGPETIQARKVDLLYLGQQHLILVFSSMALALLVGIPSGILLSRPAALLTRKALLTPFSFGQTSQDI